MLESLAIAFAVLLGFFMIVLFAFLWRVFFPARNSRSGMYGSYDRDVVGRKYHTTIARNSRKGVW